MATEDRALTAAEKRAARRARVLAGGENRLKLVTGQISTLNKGSESESAASALDKEMDSALNELLDATEDSKGASNASEQEQEAEAAADPRFTLRPDPAQRRREAALRRQKKEAIVQELLAPLTAAKNATTEPAAATVTTGASSSDVVQTTLKLVKAPTTFSRHSLALKLHAFEEKAILLAILAAAVYFAMTIDLRSIVTDLDAKDQILISYQELLAQGLPLDSIRQQMEREQLDAPVVERIERLLLAQFGSGKDPNVSFTSSFLPNVWDVPEFFASLVYRPPVIVCVLLVRLLIASIASGVHFAFSLPDVKSPQEDDLGFVVNLVLSSKPALKGYLIKFRKSLDDVFFFLYALLLVVALRAIWTAHFA